MIRHRARPTLYEEKTLWNKGFKVVSGIDEVGRGALAGPVVACAVILKAIPKFEIRDSKQLSPENRERITEKLKRAGIQYGIGEVNHEIIDDKGIMHATEMAMVKAIEGLNMEVDYHLIDYYRITSLPEYIQKPIKSGDQASLSIAAASILAKVHRDQLMSENITTNIQIIHLIGTKDMEREIIWKH